MLKALDILLDNRSVNVVEQIVNDTKWSIGSLFWIDKSTQRRMETLVREAIKRCDIEIFLDTPSECIIMSLKDSKTHIPRSKHTLSEDFNFLQEESSDMLMIHVGYG